MQIISLSRLSLKVKSEIKSRAFRGHLRKAGHALCTTRGDEHIFSPFIFTTIAEKFKSLHERKRFFAVNNPPFKETPVVGPFHYNARERGRRRIYSIPRVWRTLHVCWSICYAFFACKKYRKRLFSPLRARTTNVGSVHFGAEYHVFSFFTASFFVVVEKHKKNLNLK